MRRTVFVLLLLLAAVVAQNITPAVQGDGVATVKPVVPRAVRAVYMAGKGLAVNPNDLTDFALLKGAVGKVMVGQAEKKIGILHVDDKRYVLKNIQVENGSFYAELYESLQAAEPAGRISLDRIDKPTGEVWAGVLAFEDREYYAYLIGFRVPMPVKKVGERIEEYCKEHPEEERCQQIKQAAQNRIREYCEEHPEDARCKAVVAEYCARNLDDASCRARIREYCEKNPEDRVCERAGEVVRAAKATGTALKEKVRNCYSECVRDCAVEKNESTTAEFSCALKCRRECAFQPEEISAVKKRVKERVSEEKEMMPEISRRVKIRVIPTAQEEEQVRERNRYEMTEQGQYNKTMEEEVSA